jgi:signal peptide peptidase SppA
MPTPGKKEKKEDFVSRCIGDLVKNEGYKQDQASAICYSKWEKSKKKGGESLVGLGLFQDRAWALDPRKLDEINFFVLRRIAGEGINLEELDTGRNGNRADDTYQVKDGTAIIPVYGTLSKKMNLIMEMSGGTSTQLIKRDIAKALADEDVDSILLDIDSPGGVVDGTKELADFIFQARENGTKPIVAYTSNLMASAAYWIGSAADEIVISDTAEVGSIGVAMVHYDLSKKDEQEGVTRTNITAGKYKRIASDNQPLSDEGKEYLQDAVDTYYTIFLESVAKNREISVEAAQKMADGRVFIGKKAVDIGLADSIGSMEGAFELARELAVEFTQPKVVITEEKEVEKEMTIEELRVAHPELFKQVSDIEYEKALASTREQFQKIIDVQTGEIKVLTEKCDTFEATVAEQREKAHSAEATAIWESKLSKCDVPEELHGKVRKLISHTDFVTEETFDKTGFEAAIDAEIKSWEEGLSKTTKILGTGSSTKEVTTPVVDVSTEDDKWVEKMVSMTSSGKRG